MTLIDYRAKNDPPQGMACLVFIQSFNSEDYLGECMNSILTSDFSSFAILVYDDASNTPCLETVSKFVKANKEKVFYRLANVNTFDYPNLRYADLENIEFDFLVVCDADDLFLSRLKLSKYFEAFSQNDRVTMVSSNVRVFGTASAGAASSSKRKLQARLAKNYFLGRLWNFLTLDVATPSMALRKTAIPFEELRENPRAYPTDLLLRTRAKEKGLHIHIAEELSGYRVRDDASWSGQTILPKSYQTMRQSWYLFRTGTSLTKLRIASFLISKLSDAFYGIAHSLKNS